MPKSGNNMFSIKTSTILCFIFLTSVAKPLNILHVSFHKGCIREINFIAKTLGFNVTSLFIPDIPPTEWDGQSKGNALYNVGHERATNIWNKHKDYFNQFDAIITSDTAPIARIFLQNNYTKPIIIWICNRFDYSDQQSLDCDFPDAEYYELLQQAHDKKNVFIVPYNAFEAFYALQKKVSCNHDIIKPTGICTTNNTVSTIPSNINKHDTFFIPPYLNDAAMNLTQECAYREIPVYCGRYNGPDDLKDFKAIIHIPYAWSNVAFFENIQNGLPYFIPSIQFMHNHLNKNTIWWPNKHFFKENYHLSEWYNEENSSIITYFDSWEDLKNKIETTNFNELHAKVKMYAEKHLHTMLNKWKLILNQINQETL